MPIELTGRFSRTPHPAGLDLNNPTDVEGEEGKWFIVFTYNPNGDYMFEIESYEVLDS